MPKWPCSSGPVRNELSCCTVIARSALSHRVNVLYFRDPRRAHERAYFVLILPSRSALDTRRHIDPACPRDAQSLAEIIGIKTARQHERHARLHILQKLPIEGVAEPAWAGGLPRRARVEQQPVRDSGITRDTIEIAFSRNRQRFHDRQAEYLPQRFDSIGRFHPMQL